MASRYVYTDPLTRVCACLISECGVRREATSILGKKRRRTESVLLVLSTRTETEAAIILPDPAEDAVAETLVEIDCDLVCTAYVEIDEEAAVDVVGRGLEEVHEDAGEREASVFGRNRQGCYVTVKIMRRAFGLAQDCLSEVESRAGDNKK